MIECGLFGRWEKHEGITEKLILWMEQKWGRLKRTAFRVNGKMTARPYQVYSC